MPEFDPAKARVLFLEKAPYFASIVYGMIFVETDGVPTAAISKDMRFFYNRKWMDSLSLEEQAFVIGHEAGHIFMDHHERQKGGNFLPFMVWNVAADCEVNCNLFGIGFALSTQYRSNCASTHNLNLPSHHSAEYYFDRLMKSAKVIQLQPMGGEGGCGSGAGGQELKAEAEEGKGDSDSGEEAKGREPGDVERIRREAAEDIREYGEKSQGSIPAGLARRAEEILKEPKIDWSNLLMGVVRSIVATKRGLSDFTYSKINNRKNGKIIFPAMISPILKLGILIDTSGSMSDHELGLAISHTRSIMNQMNDSEFHLAIVDAELHSISRIVSAEDIRAKLAGGGGSNLIPAFEALEERQVSIIIAITDLYASIPEKTEAEVVWLVSGNNEPVAPYGKIIKMEEPGE